MTINIAIVYPGDAEIRKNATPDNNRFAPLFSAFAGLGVHAEPAVYHPDFADEVYQQLLGVDGVLVWINPIQDGHDRTVLDAMLKKVADAGIFISTHPDIILKIGTKEVLYQTRHMGWGGDVHLYNTFDELQTHLPLHLVMGKTRVLKQNRGHSGGGVWKIEAIPQIGADGKPSTDEIFIPNMPVRVRHAERGSTDQTMTLGDFFDQCKPYFDGNGKMLDQAYQSRLPEGMIRCYLVHDKVAGFGHQAINALHPDINGEAVQPGPRLYHPPDLPDFQRLKHILEGEWVPQLQKLFNIPTEELPIVWDTDFLLGAKDVDGNDTYVLCEINVSSVAPYPDSATPIIAQATLERAKIAKAKRG